MNRTTTAREALIVEALGVVASLLDRVESLTSSMEAGRRALVGANVDLDDRLKAFEATLSSATQQAKTKAVEHIARRAGEATRLSIEAQTQAMQEAARLAFTSQFDSTLTRLDASVRHLIQRIDRPWELWLTHAATAASAAAVTWFVATSFAFR